MLDAILQIVFNVVLFDSVEIVEILVSFFSWQFVDKNAKVLRFSKKLFYVFRVHSYPQLL